MATQVDIIERVRRRVADFDPPQTFDNSYYEDAIAFALSKLSNDFATSYTTVDLVPVARVFMLTKLASIEMCYMRASKVTDDEETSVSGEDVASITVPDLSVSGPTTSEMEKASHWMDLAKKLQKEYDYELDHTGGTSQAAEIQQTFVNRHSLTTGGLANRKMDQGLAAVVVGTPVVDGTKVSLSWGILYSPEFKYYEVYRDTDVAMEDETRIALIDDNHEVEYDDEELAADTYYYRVKTMNPNDLKTNSNIVSAVVT